MLCLALFCLFSPRAVDGDTLAVRLLNGETMYLRMEGIVSPERGEPFYREGKNAMALLVQEQMVACDMIYTDHYGRPVVTCSLSDNQDLGSMMVMLGMARDCVALSGGRYSDEEALAQNLGRDLSLTYELPPYC